MFEFLNLLVRKTNLTFIQFHNPAILERECQLMAEPLPSANDGLPRLFAFLVELVHMLHRAPVGYVALFSLSEEAVQHTAARQQSNVALVQRCYRPLIFCCFRTRTPRAFCMATDRSIASSIWSSGKPV
jgi:hypothetical protein